VMDKELGPVRKVYQGEVIEEKTPFQAGTELGEAVAKLKQAFTDINKGYRQGLESERPKLKVFTWGKLEDGSTIQIIIAEDFDKAKAIFQKKIDDIHSNNPGSWGDGFYRKLFQTEPTIEEADGWQMEFTDQSDF
jgi:hypothetical protein